MADSESIQVYILHRLTYSREMSYHPLRITADVPTGYPLGAINRPMPGREILTNLIGNTFLQTSMGLGAAPNQGVTPGRLAGLYAGLQDGILCGWTGAAAAPFPKGGSRDEAA